MNCQALTETLLLGHDISPANMSTMYDNFANLSIDLWPTRTNHRQGNVLHIGIGTGGGGGGGGGGARGHEPPRISSW